MRTVARSKRRGKAENGYFAARFSNARNPPELHEKLAIVAQAEGKSINTLAQEALQQRVAA